MNKSSLYKGCLEPIVLQLLQTHRRMYGYEITQTVKEITKGELQITEDERTNRSKPGHYTGLHILLAGTLNFAYFLVCLAYYRTVKRLEKQVKKDYPEIFNVA